MKDAALILLLLAPLPGAAQDFRPMPGVEYYCTDSAGQRRELGEVICITASCLTWMARCDMSLNNTTWRKVQDGCPGVGLAARLTDLLRG